MNGHRIDITSIKQRFDCREVASRYTTLDKPLNGDKRERHAPCPRCGGTDRFFVSPGVWGCRQCGKGGDVIALVQFAEDREFLDAVEVLDKNALAQRTPVKPSSIPERSFSETDEQRRARFLAHGPVIMDAAHRRLMEEDTPGGEYLLGRGLGLETWHRFGLGYCDDCVGRGRGVAIPWVRGGKLTAIRYRLLNPPDSKKKIISEPSSETRGVLFGGQAMIVWTKHENGLDLAADRTLVLIEGEINAMSVWQTAHDARVDVLSMGSESAHMSPAAVEYAKRYRACIVWMDKEARAQETAKIVGGSAFWSEVDGKKTDANDWLRAGKLAALLVKLMRKATPVGKQEALHWDLVDGGLL